jgi:hypothetical protein
MGDENYQAFSVDTTSGAQIPLTPSAGAQALYVRHSIGVQADMLFAINDRNPAFFDLVRVDVTTGAATRIHENEEFSRLHAAGDFSVRFGERVREDGSREILERQSPDEWTAFPSYACRKCR